MYFVTEHYCYAGRRRRLERRGHNAYGTDESTVKPVADRPAKRMQVMYSQRVYSTSSCDLLVLEQQTWSIQPIIRAREDGPTVPGQT